MFSNPELTISVIIPVHNGGPSFHTCLSKLTEAVPKPSEIIVVADGDSDGSWRLATKFGAKVIRIPESGGPARARNLGARAAQGNILFFVDADVAVCPEAIAYVANIFQRAPHLAALIGSYDDTPGAPNFLSQYRNLLHHYVHQTGREEASTFWGACGAIRREIFLAIGGFDENYRYPSIEDIELGYRLKEAGYKIRLCKNLQVKHLKRWEAISMLKADFFYRALPWTELILRDRRRRLTNDLNLDIKSRISAILAYGVLFALLAAWWWLGWLILGSLMALLLIGLNAPLYRFFQQKKGIVFALRVIPWHWLYYLYSALAFAIGTARHLSDRRFFAKINSPASAL
ncbi:MAG: glycosyltransferase family 2 protein [Actinomycetota bacterium]